MDIETYKKASELLRRKEVCQDMIDVLNEGQFSSSKAEYAMIDFFKIYHNDMLAVISTMIDHEQEAFDALQCCSCDKEPEYKEEDGGATEGN